MPLPEQVWKWLEEINKQRIEDGVQPIEHILPGANVTERAKLVKRDFADWMRKVGWTTEKACHELRKIRGSEWYTKRGLEVACAWLRHADLSTTKRYYADLMAQPPTLEVGE